MNPKRKCFWLELASWIVLIVCVAVASFVSARMSCNAEKFIGVLALLPPWVVSLFSYNAWTGIPQEERDKLDRNYGHAHFHKLTPTYIVLVLPVLCPVVALCAIFLD